MTRRVLLLAVTALALVTVSGCIRGGQAPPPIDEEAIKAGIGAVIHDFEEAVEAYDVDGMLECLSGSGFKLTLIEDGYSYDKDFATLQSELEADEQSQLAWREPEPAGFGYALDLRLGTQVFSRVTATGAIVTQTHEVYESATALGISPDSALLTDSGEITWHFAKISGEWKATAMTITFESGTKLRATARPSVPVSRGFGFGAGVPGLGH
ncbi:MAG: hypothetical protein NUW12_04415 [Firmicutes bacterium]|jgi:hypothetical protein|nr:hypothetical protein [Bacillota bacterium]MDH7495191.1 hypothetical protein [Bacillota bacterium]